MKTLNEAARDYCAAKEADRVLRLGMRECEEQRDNEPDEWGSVYDKVSPCWRVNDYRDRETGEPILDAWCPACQHNEAIIEQSRAIRSRFGGLTSAMMAAYRREVGGMSDPLNMWDMRDTQPGYHRIRWWMDKARQMAQAAREWRERAERSEAQRTSAIHALRVMLPCPACGNRPGYVGIHPDEMWKCMHCHHSITKEDVDAEWLIILDRGFPTRKLIR